MTVTTSFIRRELGELSSRLQGEVEDKLRKLFGLKDEGRYKKRRKDLEEQE
jgi:hypothetical protein